MTVWDCVLVDHDPADRRKDGKMYVKWGSHPAGVVFRTVKLARGPRTADEARWLEAVIMTRMTPYEVLKKESDDSTEEM